MAGLTHFDAAGAAQMVDVSDEARDRPPRGRARLGRDGARDAGAA